MKTLIFILTCNLISIFPSFGQLAELVAKNEKAIIQIFSYDEFGAPSSTGTGFFIKSDGTGLTNLHVLKEAKYAFVRDTKGNTYPINKISRICKECDIAEFTVNNQGKVFSTLKLTTAVPLKGSDIFVIGNPEGLESTVTKGIISAIRDEKNKIIQISAAISPGSSGSPIMDMNGNVFAIATYQHRQGQNLNFGYWIGCQEKLTTNAEFKLSNSQTGNLFVLNKVCKTESNLILNSIELNEKNTVLNMTFTNTSLAYGDNAFIFTTIGDKDKSFYIEDKNSKKRYYNYDATIGSSPKSPTLLKLGEAKKFKLFFPPIGNATDINIAEGMQGSDWSFSDINLNSYKSFTFSDENFYNNFYFQTGLALLSDKEFADAYVILKDFSTTNKDNDFAHNLAGIVSYILGNNLDAYLHIKKAIEINPTNDNYYFNLYYLNEVSENFDEALKNISSAIQLNDDSPEYYAFRAEIFMEKKFWKEAIKDYDKFINSDRQISSYHYYRRGVAKLWIQDKSACQDLEKAYSIAEDEEAKKAIAAWYNKYCRK